MDNPVDHSLDLGFVNFVQHPQNSNYVVFRFADEERAKTFKARLEESKIWFETDKENKRNKEYTLFGIHKNDFKKAQQINYDVEAKHKKPFIPFKILRYTVLVFGLGVILLAILGYCNQQDKLRRINEQYSLGQNTNS